MSSVGAARRRGPDPAVGELVVDLAVAPEVVPQDRHEPRLDDHGRPRRRTPLLDLADDLLPHGREGEAVGAVGRIVGRLGLDDAIDPEGALARSVPATRYQMSSLSTGPHRSTSRWVRPRALLL
jgi:hypothetical protein